MPAPSIERVAGGREEIQAFGMDIRRARTDLGWAPSIDLKDGVMELLRTAMQRGRSGVSA